MDSVKVLLSKLIKIAHAPLCILQMYSDMSL